MRFVRRRASASPSIGTSYNPRAPIHDAYLSAAYILKQFKLSENGAQSMGHWTYTDLFEETGPSPAAFHGEFGLVTRDGLRKACSRATATASLVWNYTMPNQTESNRSYFRKIHPAAPGEHADIAVRSLKPGHCRFSLQRTDFRANDAYTR